jgi:UDP-N-acetylglucosamine acyltransferase
MAAIDPTARIEPGAVIGQDVSIGPYCVIGPHVKIGDGCRLLAHVHVAGHTTIGPRTVLYPFASLGTPPQSVKYRGGPTRLVIGADCDIREGVTVNTGTEDDRGVTEVGDRCWLMVGSHVGHDCKVGFGDLVLALLCRGEIVRVDIFQSNEHPPTLPGAQVAKHEARRIAWTPEAKWPPRRRARR